MALFKRKPKPNMSVWFGLSYASWLTLPRVLCQEMPEAWQEKMVKLLDEFADEFPDWAEDCDDIYVTSRKSGRITRLPEWLSQYRHPEKIKIMIARGKKNED